jgi:hypothetical protein
MPATNDFQPYAYAAGANVVTQAAYTALVSLLENGLQSGVVQSNQLNKVLRQASIISAMIGQLITDATGQNAVDDGTLATLEANLARALRGDIAYGTDTGVANAYVVALAPAPLALTAGMVIRFEATNANTGASTLNVNGLGAVAITSGGAALPAGVIVAGGHYEVIYSSTANAWLLLAQTAGAVAGALTQAAADARYVQRSGGIEWSVGAPGTLTANAIISALRCAVPTTFPPNFSGSSMGSMVAALSGQTLNCIHVPAGATLAASGTVVGSATWAASGITATLATSGGAALSGAVGDTFLWQVASTADPNLADPIGTFVGSI